MPVIAFGIVLLVVIIIGVYVLVQSPLPSSTPSLTPTPTPAVNPNPTTTPTTTTSLTPTPSPIATFSPTPTSAPTSTPTSTIPPTPTPTPIVSQVTATIYAGVNSQGALGFGNSADSIQSPGPAFMFKVGDNVTLTFINTMPTTEHNWAMVDAQSATANVVFGARVNIILGLGNSTVTFTPTQAGNYYYICQVVGHFAAGMWGTITVTP